MSVETNAPELRKSAMHTANRISGAAIHSLTSSQRVTVAQAARREAVRRGRGLWGYTVAAGIAAAAVGAGLKPWLGKPTHPVAVAHRGEDGPRKVSTTRPRKQGFGEVTLPATVEAFQSARLFSRVGGYVRAWHAEIGQEVKAGDLLVQIDTPELDQQLLQARADLGIARAAVTQAEAELHESLATVDEVQADRTKSQADVELANTRLRRRAVLLSKNAATQEEYDTAIRDRDARQADVAASDASVVRQTAAVATRRAVVASREASVESAAANVRRLEELQSFQKVSSPFDGVVIRRTAEVGQLVSSGGPAAGEALYEVAQIERVRVQVSVPQSEAAGLRDGTAVTVRIPERPDEAIQATVTRTSHSVETSTRTLLAEIELPNPNGSLTPGIYAEVAIRTEAPRSRWLIPTNTVRMQVNGPHVVIAGDDGRLAVRSVKLGRDFGRQVAVLEGISGDEQLVVNPGDDLRQGTPVRAEPTTPEIESLVAAE